MKYTIMTLTQVIYEVRYYTYVSIRGNSFRFKLLVHSLFQFFYEGMFTEQRCQWQKLFENFQASENVMKMKWF